MKGHVQDDTGHVQNQNHLQISRKRLTPEVPGRLERLCLLSLRALPHTEFGSPIQNLLERSPLILFLKTRMGSGEWMTQRSKTIGNLEQTKDFEKIVHSASLALQEIGRVFHFKPGFNMKNDPYSLSIKLLVHPSIVGLNNISLNNCESLLVLFPSRKKKN